MAAKDEGLEVLIGAAKKDPRFDKLKGADDAHDDAKEYDEDEEYEEGGDAGLDALKKAFPAEQAKAIQAYVDACMKK